MGKIKRSLSCADCHVQACWKGTGNHPIFCPSKGISEESIGRIRRLYREDPVISKINDCSVKVDRENYCELTRAEEMIYFARSIGARKVGIATCVGLMAESRVFGEMLDANGIDFLCIACKVGESDKSEVGLGQFKFKQESYDPICNPVLQAEVLNNAGTDLNIIVGLCVGHDTLFIRQSKAPVTYLVVKDRVLIHNPAAALQKNSLYYKKICHQDIGVNKIRK